MLLTSNDVLIVRPRRVRGLRDSQTQIPTVSSPARTSDDPSVGVSIEPYNRIAPDLVAPTVRLVLPKSGGAYGTSHDIAGLVINCDRGVDHLHVVIEAHSPAVVRSVEPF